MPSETKISCDFCQNHLNVDSPYPDQYLTLGSCATPNSTGMVFSIGIIPILDAQKYFCGLGCLKKWLEKSND